MRNDISQRTALELNPYIEDVEEELGRIEEEAMSKYSLDETVIDDNNNVPQDSEEVEEVAEEVASKTLNGAQTQSLLSVMEQYSSGSLNLQQAINVISIAIGISKDEARKIIEGLE